MLIVKLKHQIKTFFFKYAKKNFFKNLHNHIPIYGCFYIRFSLQSPVCHWQYVYLGPKDQDVRHETI